MTVQVPDTLEFECKVYCLCATTNDKPFLPQKFGFYPEKASTACYRGYQVGYKVENDKLYLNTLTMNLNKSALEKSISPLNGVKAAIFDGVAGNVNYQEVKMPIKYNGSLIIGSEFIGHFSSDDIKIHFIELINKSYIDMNPISHKLTDFEKVIELEFDRGKLYRAIDWSEKVALCKKMTEPGMQLKLIDDDEEL